MQIFKLLSHHSSDKINLKMCIPFVDSAANTIKQIMVNVDWAIIFLLLIINIRVLQAAIQLY